MFIKFYKNRCDLLGKILKSNLHNYIPYKLNYAVTYCCNSRCNICNIWQRKRSLHNELTLFEIKKFFQINKFSWLSLTGGEPFLSQRLVDIVKCASEFLPLEILNIPTNGLISDEIVEKSEQIIKYQIPYTVITVSLDGLHDNYLNIRGIDGFNQALETYVRLYYLGRKYKNFKTYIAYTISPLNVGLLRDFVNDIHCRLAKNNIDFNLSNIHLNVYQDSDYYTQIKLATDEQHNFYSQAVKEIEWYLKHREIFNLFDFIEKEYVKFYKIFLQGNRLPIQCLAARSSFFLDPYGNLYPCINYLTKICSLHDINFDLGQIDNLLLKKLRNIIDQNNCPRCWTSCEASQSILGQLIKLVL